MATLLLNQIKYISESAVFHANQKKADGIIMIPKLKKGYLIQ
jgi:hypothetical protein